MITRPGNGGRRRHGTLLVFRSTRLEGDIARRNGAALARRYAAIPYARTRSDPEGRALEILHDAGAPAPRVNVRVAGEEADLVFEEQRVIVEIDGPQFHRFPEEDERRTRAWRQAGYVVRRIASDGVYKAPEELVRMASERLSVASKRA